MSLYLTAMIAGGKQLLRHPKLILVLVIIVVLPIALTFVMYSFVTTSVENAASVHRQRIGTVHDALHSIVISASSSTQSIVTDIASVNSDILQIDVAFDTTNNVIIVASTDSKRVGASDVKSERYSRALIQPGTPIAFEYHNNGIRYWETTSTNTAPDGTVWYVITKQSFAEFDALIDAREWYGYALLLVSFLVLLLLAVWQIRNIDYEQRFYASEADKNEQNQISNMIAHELRSPLTAMRGYASMIAEQTAPESQTHEYARRIDESTARLIQIVNDFLEVARLQSGQLKISLVECDVMEVAQKVVEELTPLAVAKNLQLSLVTEHAAVVGKFDAARLHQVLTNIVSNAIKYTKEGKVVVEVSDSKATVEFRIKDTGAGISAENQKMLFTPFFRVQNADTNAIVGTGLGMWITKRLVDSQGGTIGVESIKNVGTNVVVTMPRSGRV